MFTNLRRPPNVTPEMVARWREELSNRRQFLSYLQSLQEDVIVSVQKIEQQKETFLGTIEDLQSLVRVMMVSGEWCA